MIDDILSMPEDERPPLLVIEEEESAPAPVISQEILDEAAKVDLDAVPVKNGLIGEFAGYEEYKPGESLFRSEQDKIIDKAKRSQALEDERARFRSPLRGPYEG